MTKPMLLLALLLCALPAQARKLRIYLDAGHGAPNNHGAQNALCDFEEDFTLPLAREVAQALEASGDFQVHLSREDAPVRYQERLRAAKRFHADAFVSLHVDARGEARTWSTPAGRTCWRNDEDPGFAVLWSDAGDAAQVADRLRLAQAVATAVRDAGFVPYGGRDYGALYDVGPGEPLTFVDRNAHVYLLRQPPMPAIIIETHHGLDLKEIARWREPAERAKFAAALAEGLRRGLRR